ncbi:hypothetical protein [Paenibacillus wynnii]|nr:hypothetical protein [Paenibacillus wynnii]
MKTVIRLRDDQGNIIGTIREERQLEPIEVLRNFCVAWLILGLVLLRLI